MHRIYFDINDPWDEDSYLLTVWGSLQDIERLGDVLQVGQRVVIYMTGECESEAILERTPDGKDWVGRLVPGTWRYLTD